MVAAVVPVAERMLVGHQHLGAPAVPVLVADARQVVDDGDALQRPQVIEIHLGDVDHPAGRVADVRVEGHEAVEDARVLDVLAPTRGPVGAGRLGDAVADRQADQADAIHRRLLQAAAAEVVAVAPATVGVLAGLEAADDEVHRPLHRHVVALRHPQGEDGELGV